MSTVEGEMQNLGMLLSIVVPAFNEERYLGETLATLHRAKAFLEQETNYQAEIIVVDNDSDDATANIARAFGATLAREAVHNIAKVRNTGVWSSTGEFVVFVDADTLVPENLLSRIVAAMSDDNCLGGAFDCDYRVTKLAARVYLQCWRIIGKLIGMAQGATQFCRKDVFLRLNGYDETLFMGEDVDLYWRLKRFAKHQNRRVVFIEDIRVVPSARRFDQWQLWRTLLWTNPLLILMFRRNRTFWHGWYRAAPR